MTIPTDPKTARDYDLVIERTFDAPVALVFRVWADRDHMMRWLGPKDFTCTHLTSDFRPGGKWRACIVSDQYGENWMGGEYREIERNRRIVYTFQWDGETDEEYGQETVVTVSFAEKDGKTVQIFHQTPMMSEESRDSHHDGWSQSFNREQALVEELARAVLN